MAIRQTENVEANVVKIGMNWNVLHRAEDRGRYQADDIIWVTVTGQPSITRNKI